MRRAGLAALALLLSISTGCRTSRPAPPPAAPERAPRTSALTIRGHRIGAEVVADPEDRALGLMFRRSMARDSGMLFIFETDDTFRFWMKNTYLPLAIAYIDRFGVVSDILEMAPLDTTSRYAPRRPVRYALEMNSGWFTANGIRPGDTVQGIPGR